MHWREDSGSGASTGTSCVASGCSFQVRCTGGRTRSDVASCPTPPATPACRTEVAGGRPCSTGPSNDAACSSSQQGSWDEDGHVAEVWWRGPQATSGCVHQTHAHTSHYPRTDTPYAHEMRNTDEESSSASNINRRHTAGGISNSSHGCSGKATSHQLSGASCDGRASSCHWRSWVSSGREGQATRQDHSSCAHLGSLPSERHHLYGRPRLAPLLVLLMLMGSGPGAASARATRSKSSEGSRGSRGSGKEDGSNQADSSGCQPPEPLPGSAFKHWGCQRYNMMCIDQQQFVTYDPEFNPLISTEKPPGFDVKDVVYNWPNPYGNGDKFERGKDIHVPGVVIRVNTSEEASPDLQHPVFSACTRPIVLWQRWLYNVGEVFESSFVRMWMEFRGRDLNGAVVQAPDPRHSLVLATPHGLRVPRYAKMFFNSLFTQYEVTSLSELSARRHDMKEPSNSTAEGYHVRCFEEVLLCKIRNRQDSGLNSAGAHLLRHYRDRLPAVSDLFDVEGGDADTLKVVIASRPNATGRAILNEQELLDACSQMDPQQQLEDAGEPGWAKGAESYRGERRAFKRVKCVAHVFGRDIMYDLALAQAIDVLVATHGAAGYHSFFMSRGASFVEVMPFHFTPQWANIYYARMLENDKKVLYWQVWIQDSAHAHASAFEKSEVFRDEYVHREHHVTLPWSVLQQHLVSILQVGADALRYKAAYKAGVHCINDSGQQVEFRPNVADGGWMAVTREELQALEEQERAEAEVDSARRAATRGANGEGETGEGERRTARRRRRLL